MKVVNLKPWGGGEVGESGKRGGPGEGERTIDQYITVYRYKERPQADPEWSCLYLRYIVDVHS